MSHTVTINSVDTKQIGGLNNTVCRVYYTLTHTNSSNDTLSKQFVYTLIDPDDANNHPDTSSYAAYDSLTETQIKTWIENQAIFDNLKRSLEQSNTPAPTSSTGSPDLPWV